MTDRTDARVRVALNQHPALSSSSVQLDSQTDLVIAVDVAKRLGISPQRVNVLAAGPGFPKPLGKLGRSAVWRWSSIERWARDTGRFPAAGTPD
jgi:predicted DNA-binding transcriptional regulator AlpA